MSSWLGGGLSSLRGQLSHLITEDAHHETDSSDEVIVARLKITELENQLKTSSLDIKELADKNNELKIKLQSEEMMLQQVSDSYKSKLREKEESIESLREQISSREIKRYDESGGYEALRNEFYDFVSEPSVETREIKTFVVNDELESLRLKVFRLEQEILQWKSLTNNGHSAHDDQHSVTESVNHLLETLRQDLELQHSNYVLELQQEHNKQVHFLQRKLQRCERGSENEDCSLLTYMSHLLSEGPVVTSVKEDLSSIFQTICRMIEDKEMTVEDLFKKVHECQSTCESVQSPRLSEVACQSDIVLHSSETAVINNSLQRHVPSSNYNVAESMSQVSDISQVSVTTRLLEDNVRHLNARISDYGHQLSSIKDVTLSSQDQSEPEEVTDKLQHLKVKLSERKNMILEQNNLLLNEDATLVPTFGDSWENSSINSLAEEAVAEDEQMMNIKAEVGAILHSLDQEDSNNVLSIMETIAIIKEKIKEVEKNKKEYARIKSDLITLYKEVQDEDNLCEDVPGIIKEVKQKLLEVQGRNKRYEHVDVEGYSEQVTGLNDQVISLTKTNEALGREVEDLSSTLTRYADLEKVCDCYEKELLELKGEGKKSDLCMDSKDILEHVKTFNEEKDELIEKLESRIICLQNFCEEKDDYIKALKKHEVELIYEYDCSIGVLNCELDNLRASVEKSYENEIDYKKQIYRINAVTREKDDMINSLNEELTMLSHQNTDEDMVMMMSVKKVEVSSQTELNDCGVLEEDGVDMMMRSKGLVSENMRLGEVIEAQANSLGLYEEKVKSLEAELAKLTSSTNRREDFESSEDMTRETLHHLSTMIRDKDFEIESLKSKNESLYDLIKQSTETSDHGSLISIDTLINEKDALSKEIVWYQENREQLVNALNLKHKESLNYHGEIQRLVAFINTEQSKWNQLALENESIKENIKLLVEEKRTNKTYLVDASAEFKDSLPSYSECMMSGSNEELKLINEKINHLEQENQQSFGDVKKLERQLEKVSFELEESRLQVYTLTESHNLCQTQILHYQDELSKIGKTEIGCNQMSENTKDIWNEDKEAVMNLQSEYADLDQRGTMQNVEDQLRLLKLQVADQQHEMDQMKSREMKLLKEKQIFQDHLIRVEESYTQDATIAEDREQSLRRQLRDVEDKMTMAQEHITSLEHKLTYLTDNFLSETCDIRFERDESLKKLRTTELRLEETLRSLTNLQTVLDKIQQDHSAEISFQRERLQHDWKLVNEDRDKWKTKSQELQVCLETQNEVVEAAQRLTDQMESKDDELAKMQATMSRKEEMIDGLKMEIRKLNSVTESKVDKVLMRNLIIGYFHTPLNKRQDALRVIGSLLQFNDNDYNQIGIDTANKSRWFSWLRTATLSNKELEQVSKEHSFSELFIRFLERESTPLPQVRLPTNQVAAEARKHSSLSYTEEYPYVNMTSSTTISDHHKFFSPSPIISKRNSTLGEECNASQKEVPPLFISNLQELKSDNYQTVLNPTSSVRRTDSKKNALLSLLEQ